MAKDIKLEFEEYVRELTQSISKEIFLDDLKEICDKYQKQLQQYEKLIGKAEDAAERIDTFAGTEEADIRSLSQRVNSELTQMDQMVQSLGDTYGKLFEQFSREVNQLNQRERDAFVQTLDKKIIEYEEAMEKGLQKEYESLFQSLIQDFENVCRKNDVQYKDFETLVQNAKEVYASIVDRQESSLQQMKHMDQQVDRKLQAVSDRIQDINTKCTAVFQQFSQKVTTLNEKERKTFTGELQAVLDRYRNTFAEEIAVKYVSISDKFRNDLSGIYKEYEKQLEEYRRILQEVQKNSLIVQQFTAQNIPELKRLSTVVEDSLKEVNRTLTGITQSYQSVFGEFSDRVSALNDTERQKFLTAMKESFGRELTAIQQDFAKTQKEWEETADQLLQGIRSSVEEQKQGYQYDRKVFMQYIGQQITDFKKNIDQEVQIQQKLSEQLQQEHRELVSLQKDLQSTRNKIHEDEETFHFYIEKHEKEYAQMLENLQQTQTQMEKSQLDLWHRMLGEWERRERSLDKQREFAAWKLFMMVTNTLLVLLFSVLVYLQKPWESLSQQQMIILLAVFGVLVLILLLRKLLVRLFISNKKAAKKE